MSAPYRTGMPQQKDEMVRAVSLGPDGKMSAHDVRRVAVEAGVDPRSVRRFLKDQGANVRSTTAARIGEALRALGFYAAKDG